MAGRKKNTSSALFLVLNLVFFTLSNACNNCPRPIPNPSPQPNAGGSPPSPGSPGTNATSCPINALTLGVCANVLGELLSIVIGSPSTSQCCSLISGLVDLEAAVCLCLAIRANILGINLNIPLALTLLLNVCDRTAPQNFQCELS